jgi:ribosomal protein S18 acetylase RimI-like enzyme
MDIAPLTAADVPAAAALVAALPLYRRYGYAEAAVARDLAAALADPRSAVLAARADGALVGLLWAIDRGAFARSLYVKLVAVHADAHSRGVGRALVRAAEAMPQAARGVALLCSADNEPAQRFYERLGYLRVGAIPSYVAPDLDELIYYRPADTTPREPR